MAKEHPSARVQQAINRVENEILNLKWDLVKITMEFEDKFPSESKYREITRYIETLETVKGMLFDI